MSHRAWSPSWMSALPAPTADVPLRTLVPAGDRAALGALLAEARHARRMTQRELEQASGVPQGKISRIERGQSYPALVTIIQVAEALGLEVSLSISPAT